jgi:hypothetical protein
MTSRDEDLAHAQGVEEGLATAIAILEELAAVMIERERTAKPGKKANHPRRARIKAYQVAANRIDTRLTRQRRRLAKLETPADEERAARQIRSAVAKLAL